MVGLKGYKRERPVTKKDKEVTKDSIKEAREFSDKFEWCAKAKTEGENPVVEITLKMTRKKGKLSGKIKKITVGGKEVPVEV